MTPILRSIQLANRLTLPYVEQGDPAGVPVVFLHGVTDSWRSFEPVLPHLPASIHALALTQRGHGDADKPLAGYRTRDFAGDLAAFLDAMKLERAVLVGHSMGTTHALRFAIDHPERTLALVLAGAFATYRGNPGMVDFQETAIAPLVDPIAPSTARDFQQSTLAQPIPADFFELVVRESLKVPAHVWRAAFRGFLEDDFADEIAAVAAPTLILWGARDDFCPRADQETLCAAIAGARLKVYERAGHALHWEEPERFATDVAAFVGSIAGLRNPHHPPAAGRVRPRGFAGAVEGQADSAR
jgi:pimeloyl-ACP methyl ester carboxylesterase